MKKFILLFVVFILLFCVINISLRIVYYYSKPSLLLKNQIEKNTSTIVLGPSNGECAWNDSIIGNSINLCRSGQSLGGSYSALRWAVEYNNAEIDTIVLCASLIGIVYNSDDNLLEWYEEDNCLFEYDVLFDFFKDRPSYWGKVTTQFPYNLFLRRKPYGGYIYTIRDKLDDPMVNSAINTLISQAGGKSNISENYFRTNCKYQLHYLRKIRDYCAQHHKKLVILSTPIYRIPNLIDDSGYRQLICHELGDSALIADYSRFEFPDSTYYGDLEHLNYRGAEYFSKHVAKNGLKHQYAIDYCK